MCLQLPPIAVCTKVIVKGPGPKKTPKRAPAKSTPGGANKACTKPDAIGESPKKPKETLQTAILFRNTIDPFYQREEPIPATLPAFVPPTEKPGPVKVICGIIQQVQVINGKIELCYRVALTTGIVAQPVASKDDPKGGVLEEPKPRFYKNIHTMIAADLFGDATNLRTHHFSKAIQEAKMAEVDQLMYSYDNNSRLYVNERVPWFVSQQLVEGIADVAQRSEQNPKQRFDAVDLPGGLRYIVRVEWLRHILDMCAMDMIMSKHMETIYHNVKPPRRINVHHLQIVVRKAILHGLTNETLAQLQAIPDGANRALEFLSTCCDTYGWQYNMFYKDQIAVVISEIFQPTFRLEH